MDKIFFSSSKCRILINALHAKSGGGVTYLCNLLPELVSLDGIEIHVVLTKSQLGLAEHLMPYARVHIVNVPKGIFGLLFWEQCVLPVLLRETKVDVVFSPANYGPLVLRHQVIMLRNALDVGRKESRFLKQMYWKGLAVATFLSLLRSKRAVAVSAYAADSMSPSWLRSKVRIIPHGVSGFSATQNRGEASEKFILAVSDIYIQKNLHTLIEAFAIVAKADPDLRLFISGKVLDKKYYDKLMGMIQEFDINDNVIFLGHCNKQRLEWLYNNCIVFVFPSTVETFGNPLLEAMACGAPVVCSNTSAIPEVAGDAALYFDPDNHSDIAVKLLSLVESPEERQRLSVLGQERSRRFTWQHCASETAAVLREAMVR